MLSFSDPSKNAVGIVSEWLMRTYFGVVKSCGSQRGNEFILCSPEKSPSLPEWDFLLLVVIFESVMSFQGICFSCVELIEQKNRLNLRCDVYDKENSTRHIKDLQGTPDCPNFPNFPRSLILIWIISKGINVSKPLRTRNMSFHNNWNKTGYLKIRTRKIREAALKLLSFCPSQFNPNSWRPVASS
jgi:hypothetical protein